MLHGHTAGIGQYKDSRLWRDPAPLIAVWGDTEAARILLDEGAEIDAPGEHAFTPLHEAIQQGHVDLAKLLITRGASLTQKNEWDMDARELAAIHESFEILTLLETL